MKLDRLLKGLDKLNQDDEELQLQRNLESKLQDEGQGVDQSPSQSQNQWKRNTNTNTMMMKILLNPNRAGVERAGVEILMPKLQNQNLNQRKRKSMSIMMTMRVRVKMIWKMKIKQVNAIADRIVGLVPRNVSQSATRRNALADPNPNVAIMNHNHLHHVVIVAVLQNVAIVLKKDHAIILNHHHHAQGLLDAGQRASTSTYKNLAITSINIVILMRNNNVIIPVITKTAAIPVLNNVQ